MTDRRPAWGPAVLISVVVHATWVVVAGWYLKVPDSVLCSNDQSGFFPIFPPCPEPRPAAGTIALVALLGGLIAGTVIPAALSDIDLYDPWTWTVFAIIVPIGMALNALGLLILFLMIA